MNEHLFELFDNADLVRNDNVNVSKIRKLSANQIADLSYQTAILTSAKEMPRERSAFAHSASRSLSGEPWPCQELSCRLRRATELAQFAALYSERVYFRNFLGDYSTHFKPAQSSDISKLRQSLADDIAVFLYLRPLIEKGLLIPVTPPQYCLHCLTTHSFGSDADKRFKRVFRDLTQRYNEETNITFKYEDGLYWLQVEGPELLMDHSGVIYFSPRPNPVIAKMPRVMKGVMAGKEMLLSQSTIRKMRFDQHLAGETRSNIVFELAASLSIGTMFLTDRALDIELLRQLSVDPSIEQRNQLLQKHITCIVPFIDSVRPVDLMKLRQTDGDSFILFRNSLTKAIDEYRGQKTGLTERDAKAVYGDIIQPQLARLDSKVHSARRNLIKKTTAQIAGWTAAISIGLYAGLLPSGIAAAAAALGLTKVLAELGQDLLTKRDVEEEIRQEELYFLWKVRKLARQ